jgi:hypothetical protein
MKNHIMNAIVTDIWNINELEISHGLIKVHSQYLPGGSEGTTSCSIYHVYGLLPESIKN